MAARPRAVYIIGALAIVVAAAASLVLYKYLKHQEEMVSRAVATEKVVVAVSEISIGTTIGANQLGTADWPRANLPEGAMAGVDEAVGRVALQTIQPGDPVTEAKLLPKGGAPGVLSYRIPEGHRAITVGVDQVTGVAGFIQPGNMVDVVLITRAEIGKEPVSKIVLQNVPVLATGQVMIEEQKESGPTIVPTVTMDVTPEEAEVLTLASNQGTIQLLLRRTGDRVVEFTRGVTIRNIIAGADQRAVKIKQIKPAVRKAPEAGSITVSVEVLRDAHRNVEKFRVRKDP